MAAITTKYEAEIKDLKQTIANILNEQDGITLTPTAALLLLITREASKGIPNYARLQKEGEDEQGAYWSAHIDEADFTNDREGFRLVKQPSYFKVEQAQRDVRQLEEQAGRALSAIKKLEAERATLKRAHEINNPPEREDRTEFSWDQEEVLAEWREKSGTLNARLEDARGVLSQFGTKVEYSFPKDLSDYEVVFRKKA